MKKVLIFGGTGFIGKSLAHFLASKNFRPILVARNIPKEDLPFGFLQWDAQIVGDWAKALNDAFAIVNLAGKSVDCIKTPENCDTILRSRVDSTLAIGKALKSLENPPKVWIQMSTAHVYGDSENTICTEESSTGYGLAPFVGQAWEKAFFESLIPEMRGVILRTSFVIGKKGGALHKLKRLAQIGFGGKVGSGKQGISWIHQEDLNHLIWSAILEEKYKGIYIASAPHPVSNHIFMKTLRQTLGMPIGIPAPAFLAKLGAKIIFNTDHELALYGRYVYSKRLQKEGFTFHFPKIEKALKDLIS